MSKEIIEVASDIGAIVAQKNEVRMPVREFASLAAEEVK